MLYDKTHDSIHSNHFFHVTQHTASLHIMIFDEDVVTKNDYIGRTTLLLSEFENKANVDMWFPLMHVQHKNISAGEIRLDLTYHCDKYVDRESHTRLFGVQLQEIMAREENKGCPVPLLVRDTLQYLNEKALFTEGIFRISGNATDLEQYKVTLNKGHVLDISKITDQHTVAGLLKMFIRELPDPVFTHKLFPEFLSTIEIKDEPTRISTTQNLLAKLPPENIALLRELVLFLKVISEHSDKNKMTISNIAIVFGPNLLRSSEEGNMFELVRVNAVMSFIIQHAKALL